MVQRQYAVRLSISHHKESLNNCKQASLTHSQLVTFSFFSDWIPLINNIQTLRNIMNGTEWKNGGTDASVLKSQALGSETTDRPDNLG